MSNEISKKNKKTLIINALNFFKIKKHQYNHKAS